MAASDMRWELSEAMTSWTFFFALGFVLALAWGALELYRAGYRAGLKDADVDRALALFEQEMMDES
jgi:hypothetical protein